jgi:hypothetical protein
MRYTDHYKDKKTAEKATDWHKNASDILVKHGFKHSPDHDVYGGSDEGVHQSRHTAWVHPSGARITLGHHVTRNIGVDQEAHPDLGNTRHNLSWSYRNDKSKSWGSRSSIGEVGNVDDRTQKPVYSRHARALGYRNSYPTKYVSPSRAVEKARAKEGWQLTSHSLRALAGSMRELHPAPGEKPTGKPVTQIAAESVEEMIMQRMSN